jgi:hypothetical protein
VGIVHGLEDYKINPFEYGFLTTSSHYTSGSFRLYIPKLMPLMSLGQPSITNWIFNNNIFLNDADCKPTTGQKITTQNFITVGRHHNRDFGFKSDKYGYIGSGTRFVVHVMDENIRDMRISDVI